MVSEFFSYIPDFIPTQVKKVDEVLLLLSDDINFDFVELPPLFVDFFLDDSRVITSPSNLSAVSCILHLQQRKAISDGNDHQRGRDTVMSCNISE